MSVGELKDRSQVSFDILKESLLKYQKTVKIEKSEYFSDIISNNSHTPCVLFSAISSALNTPPSTCLGFSVEMCENSLTFFLLTIFLLLEHHTSHFPLQIHLSTECSAVLTSLSLFFKISLLK